MRLFKRSITPAVVVVLFAAMLAAPSSAQSKKSAAEKDREILANLMTRVETIEQQLSAFQGGSTVVPADKKDQKVLPLLDSMYYGPNYYSSNGPRFFVAKLFLINLTPQDVTVSKADVQLLVEKKTLKNGDIPANVRSATFYVGSQHNSMSSIKVEDRLVVKPGTKAVTWIAFAGMPSGNALPKMTLQIKLGKKTETISVNEFAGRRLAMKSERIGPRKCLGLITVSGSLNTVSIGELVNAIDEFAKQKMVRTVIRWDKSAPGMNSRLHGWLQQSANYAGRGNTNNFSSSYPFPVIPATIRELHLAQMPNNSSSYGANGPTRIHKTDVDAVSAALESAYEILPSDELVKEIETGHPLSRPAALANGGGRLPSDKLPLILKYADDKDPKLQIAALTALQHFGDKPAIEKLSYFARKDTTNKGEQAIASLAASRFAAAHEELLRILKTEPPKSKAKIVKVLAEYPRPLWADTIYEYAQDKDVQVRWAALKSLGVIGHPKLLPLLEASLKSGLSEISKEAFRQLLSHKDPRSEEIALEYALEQMKAGEVESQMYSLIQRTKDPRAIPHLLKHLDRQLDKNSSDSNLVNTLAMIGDQAVGGELAKRYPKMKSDSMKSYTLRALVKLKSPAFRPLAGEALLSKNYSLISAACDALRTDASKESVRLLIEAFNKTTDSSTLSYTSNSLATIGTPEARRALIRGRDSSDANKRRYSISALRNLMQRSPGYQYVYRAQESVRQKRYTEAIDHYTLALKLDGDLSTAMSGRGQLYLKLNKTAEAKKDFDAALKIDPEDLEAVTGSAILQARDGKYKEAVKLAESIRDTNKSNANFLYNAARIYARGITALNNTKASPERDKTIKEYEKKAIADLQQAMNYGKNYSNGVRPADARDEADFVSLRKLPEFQKIIASAGKKSSKKPANGKRPRVVEDKAKTAG